MWERERSGGEGCGWMRERPRGRDDVNEGEAQGERGRAGMGVEAGALRGV